MKKVGILGSGDVAKALAKGFVGIGFEVKMGSREISKLADVPNVSLGSFEEAADFGDLIVLAVKGTAASELLKSLEIEGKIVIDTTNPIEEKPPVNGVLQFFTKQNNSLGEQLQKENPNVHIVKAFNSVGSALMVNPDFGTEKPTMFIAGNNSQAKNLVKEIARDSTDIRPLRVRLRPNYKLTKKHNFSRFTSMENIIVHFEIAFLPIKSTV